MHIVVTPTKFFTRELGSNHLIHCMHACSTILHSYAMDIMSHKAVHMPMLRTTPNIEIKKHEQEGVTLYIGYVYNIYISV